MLESQRDSRQSRKLGRPYRTKEKEERDLELPVLRLCQGPATRPPGVWETEGHPLEERDPCPKKAETKGYLNLFYPASPSPLILRRIEAELLKKRGCQPACEFARGRETPEEAGVQAQ